MNRLFYINRYYGWSIKFRNGLSLGFNWMHGNGSSSKTSATLAAFHSPKSIAWRWALRWDRPHKLLCLPSIKGRRGLYGWCSVGLPLVGGFSLSWQPTMLDREVA